MRQVREVLRLKLGLGLKDREIARSCSIPHSSVGNYVARAKGAGLGWPLPADLSDDAIERLLFPPEYLAVERPVLPQPDFAAMHRELRRHRYVTLQLLWQEYRECHPDGYQYSRFCELYARWARKLDIVLRQEHRAGDKTFVDHAGPTVAVVDAVTGQIGEASIFVAVLGASSYTFAEATWKRDLAAWIGSHNRMVGFFRGVTTVVVPDNWKTGVKDACYYEPELNPTYRDWAEHHATVIIPARVRKPRDKALVENAVLVVERWILAALRHRTFFSLAELNDAIRELLHKLNHRKFRKLDTTRARLFEELERPALKPLPAEPFTFREWKKVRVHPDYHVEIFRHYYSVHHDYMGEQVEACIFESTIEIFRNNRRIATHVRSSVPGGHTTLAEHRPKKHQDLKWTSATMIERGRAVGPSTMAMLEQIMASRKHPELGYRACLGVLRLGKRYGNERLEAACARALAARIHSYRSVQSILASGLDHQPLQPVAVPAAHHDLHANVRGAGYYREKGVA